MTRILHLITGADGAGLPLSAAADLAALPGPGLHLVTTAWMIPAPDLLGHEDLRLRAGHATRLAVMAEILLRDYGGRSAPVLLLPSLEAASLTLGHDTMLSWTEVLGGLQSAFRQAGTDLHLQLWQVQVPGSVTPETVTDLAAALGEEGVVVVDIAPVDRPRRHEALLERRRQPLQRRDRRLARMGAGWDRSRGRYRRSCSRCESTQPPIP